MSDTKSAAESVLPRFTRMGTAAVAGGMAGLVALGAGGRLVMRIMALTSDNFGRLTENGNRAGDFTAGGTGFLVLAGGLVGAALGLVHLSIRRFLPSSPGRRALMLGVLTMVFVHRAVLSPENPDFERFGPALLAVVLFVSCLFGFGVGFSFVYDWLTGAVAGFRPGTWATFLWGMISAGAVLLAVVLVGGLGAGSWQGLILVILVGLGFWGSNQERWQLVVGSNRAVQIGRLTLAGIGLLGMLAVVGIAVQVIIQAT